MNENSMLQTAHSLEHVVTWWNSRKSHSSHVFLCLWMQYEGFSHIWNYRNPLFKIKFKTTPMSHYKSRKERDKKLHTFVAVWKGQTATQQKRCIFQWQTLLGTGVPQWLNSPELFTKGKTVPVAMMSCKKNRSITATRAVQETNIRITEH